jgi:hypothetical protein
LDFLVLANQVESAYKEASAKEKTMQLQDGKLYETADGRRFRVKLCVANRYFECPQSYSSSWIDNGTSYLCAEDNLVRLVEENRWVSVSEDVIPKEDRVYRWKRGHLQMRVTREEARRRAPNYTPPQKAEPVAPAYQSGHILAPKDNAWFTWSFSTENGVTYLDIETSKGAKLTFPL